MRAFSLIALLICILCTSRTEAGRLDPTAHKLLSNPGYAKYIDVECYIVTREQVAKVFSQKNGVITQLPNNQLRSKPVYLLVRCKNKGSYMAFGDLHCYVPNRGSPIPIDMSDLRGGDASSYFVSVVQICSGLIEDNDKIPAIKYQWDCLYNY
ncbi:hypothetical protein [Candidatus Neptunochlamydia vexilliferae]|uniref:Secreted protein n=1 Tax=Candidatus Neptunichlamydia vexilliferae TaxID=1651774 RepID=A0ABS0AYR2_9BACT|nr:hypothetical protein [Candidatus Neptunochlamydia vexilliferae]MBF5059269.1 hypothetical protein [Candidatus Neptunochlamydia vexilliferae]